MLSSIKICKMLKSLDCTMEEAGYIGTLRVSFYYGWSR